MFKNHESFILVIIRWWSRLRTINTDLHAALYLDDLLWIVKPDLIFVDVLFDLVNYPWSEQQAEIVVFLEVCASCMDPEKGSHFLTILVVMSNYWRAWHPYLRGKSMLDCVFFSIFGYHTSCKDSSFNMDFLYLFATKAILYLCLRISDDSNVGVRHPLKTQIFWRPYSHLYWLL